MSEQSSETTASWRLEQGEEGVRTLWFDVPGRSHNVLDPAAFESLDGHLGALERDASATGLLVRSAKEKGFCAGADLKTFLECESADQLTSYLRRGLEVIAGWRG
jgi:3-hydroxyacyl-CoA dehydrogenase/enoyl-CoA hydratase/3-hydroxybutyryl-CoA epimerase